MIKYILLLFFSVGVFTGQVSAGPKLKLGDGLNLKPDPNEKITLPYPEIVMKYADEYGVDFKIIYAAMWAQSGFDRYYDTVKRTGIFAYQNYSLDKYHPGKNVIRDIDYAIKIGVKDLQEAQRKYKSPTKIYISAFKGDDLLLEDNKDMLEQTTMATPINKFNDMYRQLAELEKKRKKEKGR